MIYSNAIFANSPDTSTFEIRRPLSFILPYSSFESKNGYLMYLDYHSGEQYITVSDGTPTNTQLNIQGFSSGYWFNWEPNILVTPFTHLSKRLLPGMDLNIGAQIDWLVYKQENLQFILNAYYNGVFVLLFPSVGSSGQLKYNLYTDKSFNLIGILGLGLADNIHQFHKVKIEGQAEPSERFNGQLVTQYYFCGLSFELQRKYFFTLELGNAHRRSETTINYDPVGYVPGDGSFISINGGLIMW